VAPALSGHLAITNPDPLPSVEVKSPHLPPALSAPHHQKYPHDCAKEGTAEGVVALVQQSSDEFDHNG
jgi:hypothetical protein